MNLDKFIQGLSSLYYDWNTLNACPKDNKFSRILSQVDGMTTASVLQLLNHAVGCLDPEEAYCEVGCLRGATIIGATLGHDDKRAIAIDNFSEHNPGYNYPTFLTNLKRFNTKVEFHNKDFEAALIGLRKRQIKIGAYFYDAAHDYRSQLMGLLLAVPLLADKALLVIDDTNSIPTRQATIDFLVACPQAKLLFDLRTPGNGHSSFWNGIMVLGWSIWQSCEPVQERHESIIKSIYALQ